MDSRRNPWLARSRGPAMTEAAAARLRRVSDYYDQTTTLYIRHFGTTLQAGLIGNNRDASGIQQMHNACIARRAGLNGGERVLDAGCGVCGPAIDMAARLPGLSVIGVTISGIQARLARRLVWRAGLQSRVHVVHADFLRLPLAGASVDVVLFLESAGYAHDQRPLFAEARRVLATGGTLYVKDVFVRESELSQSQERGIKQFNRAFAYDVRRVSETIAAIEAAGLATRRSTDLSPVITTELFKRAMFVRNGPRLSLNDFGRRHYAAIARHPIYFAEIVAKK